jgi:hypothetical protein
VTLRIGVLGAARITVSLIDVSLIDEVYRAAGFAPRPSQEVPA